jgi:hypothetical protein
MGMSQIDIAELGAAEQRRNIQEQMRFQGQQAAAQRAQQMVLTQADLTMQERSLSESARQFDNQQTFNQWATENGWTQDQAARAWQANQNDADRLQRGQITYAELTQQERTLMENARQADNELAFKTWATQSGYTQDEANRVWQANQNQMDRAQRGELTYAELSVEEKRMAQDALQFGTEIEFRRWATQAGIDDNTANRVWQGAQNQLDRQQRGELAYADLNLREMELSQQASQFTDRLDFDRWATEAGFSENETERAWQANQNNLDRGATLTNLQTEIASREGIASADRQLQYTALYQDASQYQAQLNENIRQFNTSTGVDRERLAAEIQMSENELESATNRLQMQLDNDRTLEGMRFTNQYDLETLRQTGERTMAEINNQLQQGTLDYQWANDQRTALDNARAMAYYNQGVSGQDLTPEELTYLQQSDPLAYFSYQSGRSGETQATVEFQQSLLREYMNGMILNLSDQLGTPDFANGLAQVFAGVGFDPTQVAGIGTGSNVGSTGTTGGGTGGTSGTTTTPPVTTGSNPLTPPPNPSQPSDPDNPANQLPANTGVTPATIQLRTVANQLNAARNTMVRDTNTGKMYGEDAANAIGISNDSFRGVVNSYLSDPTTGVLLSSTSGNRGTITDASNLPGRVVVIEDSQGNMVPYFALSWNTDENNDVWLNVAALTPTEGYEGYDRRSGINLSGYGLEM